jgi:hypothetical protein
LRVDNVTEDALLESRPRGRHYRDHYRDGSRKAVAHIKAKLERL